MDSEETTLMVAVPNTALMPAMDMRQAAIRYQTMQQFVKEILHEGTDYGIVPGTEKPTLLKAGAEKLTTLFGLSTKFVVVEKAEDWMGKDHEGEPFFYYWYRCQLWRGDLLIAEGDGSCNSYESKYRWRWVPEGEIPLGLDSAMLKKRDGTISEFGFAVEKAETSGKYGKPAEYWQRFNDAIENGEARAVKKLARSGKEYDAWEIGAPLYRIFNDDIASQVNTIQKMAQKRALVAATLIAVNASDYFTQDIEDLYSDMTETVIRERVDEGLGQKPQPRQQNTAQGNGGKAQRPLSPEKLREGLQTRAAQSQVTVTTDKQRGLLAGKLNEALGGDDKRYTICRWLWGNESGSSRELTPQQVDAMLRAFVETDAEGHYQLHPAAKEELERVYRAALEGEGRADMFERPAGDAPNFCAFELPDGNGAVCGKPLADGKTWTQEQLVAAAKEDGLWRCEEHRKPQTPAPGAYPA